MSENGFPVEFVPTLLTPEEVEGEFNLALRRMEVLHLRSVINRHVDMHFPTEQWDFVTGDLLMNNLVHLRDDTLQKMRGE